MPSIRRSVIRSCGWAAASCASACSPLSAVSTLWPAAFSRIASSFNRPTSSSTISICARFAMSSRRNHGGRSPPVHLLFDCFQLIEFFLQRQALAPLVVERALRRPAIVQILQQPHRETAKRLVFFAGFSRDFAQEFAR